MCVWCWKFPLSPLPFFHLDLKVNDVVPWVLDLILNKHIISPNPHVRQAACIWLLSMVKKLSTHKAIKVRNVSLSWHWLLIPIFAACLLSVHFFPLYLLPFYPQGCCSPYWGLFWVMAYLPIAGEHQLSDEQSWLASFQTSGLHSNQSMHIVNPFYKMKCQHIFS